MAYGGGAPGIRYHESLHYAVERPFLVFFGQEQYPYPFLKAAVMAEIIIRGHPFSDGNKRTGYLAGITLLELLTGLTVEAGDEEIERVCLAVEGLRMGAEELASWMEDHAEPVVDRFGDVNEEDTARGFYERRHN